MKLHILVRNGNTEGIISLLDTDEATKNELINEKDLLVNFRMCRK